MKPEKRTHEHSLKIYPKPGTSLKIKALAQEKGISISKTVVQLLTIALKDRSKEA